MTNIKIKTKLLAKSADEPISLEEAKIFLRITHNTEDSLIISLIKAVRDFAENYLRISITTSRWQAQISDFSNREISLPKAPIQTVDEVFIIKKPYNKVRIPSDLYYFNDNSELLIFNNSVISKELIITYITGYKRLTDIPYAIKQAMLIHLATIYDNRSNNVTVSKAILDYYQPYRKLLI